MSKTIPQPPKNFKVQFEEICKNAPINEYNVFSLIDNKLDINFQILIYLILSSDTEFNEVAIAMNKLKEHGLSIDKMVDIKSNELLNLLSNIVFKERKVKHIKLISNVLKDHLNYKIPDKKEDMINVLHFSNYYANLAMFYCYNSITGVCLNVSGLRVVKRLGWYLKNDITVATKYLESWLEKENWHLVYEKLTSYGQNICKACTEDDDPKCNDCSIDKKTCIFYSDMF